MLKLITFLENLTAETRRLTDEENIYLDQLGDELRQAESDAARWRILEREGLHRLEGFDFSEDVLARLTTVRRAAMN